MRDSTSMISIMLLITGLLAGMPGLASSGLIHHDISAAVYPAMHTIQVRDTVSLPRALVSEPLHFVLYAGLKVDIPDRHGAGVAGYDIDILEGPISGAVFGLETGDMRSEMAVPVTHYRLTYRGMADEAETGPVRITLTYSGEINHPVAALSREYERSFSTTPGIISADGVVLSGSSVWLPWFGPGLMTFRLDTDLPDPWISVSQGRRTHSASTGGRTASRWECPDPMDDVYLIAAPFTEYSRMVSNVSVMAFLRSPDPELADRYLDVTGRYLDLYTRLIGRYPFTKFALIENFWETGYGMPSFTLLGPTVIRLPFILHSSYPHELLHNWWGNGVYVDYASGNWCEGLTSYLADHLIKEQRGQGAEYRFNALQKYTDYVRETNDFPLSQFTSRIHAPSEAVGYGKSMMMFHMLRRELGDTQFTRVLQSFYASYLFRYASFDDIRQTVETVTGTDWSAFFTQWITRTGAPALAIRGCRILPAKGPADRQAVDRQAAESQPAAENSAGRVPSSTGTTVELTLEQTQEGDAYRLLIPVAITLKNAAESERHTVTMTQKRQSFRLNTAGDPVRVDVDPEFDVFRRLDRTEIPPALSQVFGAETVTIVLPESDTPARVAAYRELAESWSGDSPGQFTVLTDAPATVFPPGSLWILGRANRYAAPIIDQLRVDGVAFSSNGVSLHGASVPYADHALVFAARHPVQPDTTVAWISIDHPESLKGLTRKLPHYGKYSYLVFEGTEPQNILSGRWQPSGSPLTAIPEGADTAEGAAAPMASVPMASVPMAPVPPRPVLAELPAVFDVSRMMDHIRFLSGPALEGRGLGSAGLDAAAEYIAQQFEAAGLRPGGDEGSWYQTWLAQVEGFDTPVTLKNVIGIRPGRRPDVAGQPVILCAHYDHLGRDPETGAHFPGADDNASGVAVMCELASHLSSPLDRDLFFIAFTGEETARLGSKHFVQNSHGYPIENTFAVINLDGLGRFDNDRFLVIGAGSAREWPHLFIGCGHATGVRSHMVSEPLDSSDQESFIEAGVPAVQLFSGPHRDYHTPRDTVDKINADGLGKAAALTAEAIRYLGNRPEPLTRVGNAPASAQAAAGERSVGTGSMPDFTFNGPGVRLADVTDGSPAAAAGLQAGDILMRLDGRDISDIRTYSAVLRDYQPGDTVAIEFIREGATQMARLTLGPKAYR